MSEVYGKEHNRRYEKISHEIRRNTIHNQGGRCNKESKIIEIEMDRTCDERAEQNGLIS